MKATIAVLGFILSSAAKHNVDGESLSSELQQLGLPKGKGGDPQGGRHRQLDLVGWQLCCRFCAVHPSGCVTGVWPQRCRRFSCLVCPCHAEHAGGLCRSYEEKQSSLQERLRACSLRRECRAAEGGITGLGVGVPAPAPPWC